jgi:hypothetical protein
MEQIREEIKRNLQNSHFLASLLFKKVTPEPQAPEAFPNEAKKLFETLDEQTIELIKASPNWDLLRKMVKVNKGLDLDLVLAFNKKFNIEEVNFDMDKETRYALYIQAIRVSEPTPELLNFKPENDDLLKIIEVLKDRFPDLQGLKIEQSSIPHILVCPNGVCASIIMDMKQENANYMYVSPQIARAVYLEVEEKNGQTWDMVEGTKLNNIPKPDKLTHALKLLGINGKISAPNNNRSKQGFVLTAKPESLVKLKALSNRRPQFIISPELEQNLYSYAVRRAENPDALVGFSNEDKLNEALRICGLEVSHITLHPDGRSYWVQLESLDALEFGWQQSAIEWIVKNERLGIYEYIVESQLEGIDLSHRQRNSLESKPAFDKLDINDPARTREMNPLKQQWLDLEGQRLSNGKKVLRLLETCSSMYPQDTKHALVKFFKKPNYDTHREKIQQLLSTFGDRDHVTVRELLQELYNFKSEQTDQQNWPDNVPLNKLIQLIETNLRGSHLNCVNRLKKI